MAIKLQILQDAATAGWYGACVTYSLDHGQPDETIRFFARLAFRYAEQALRFAESGDIQ